MKATKLDKAQSIKILKVAGYTAVSAVLGYLIAVVTEQPELFGVFAPIINITLVTIRQVLVEPK